MTPRPGLPSVFRFDRALCVPATAEKGGSSVAFSQSRDSHRLTRRGFVRTVGAGIALGALAPAIVPRITSAAPARSPAAATPGVLVVGLVAEPTSLDPGQLTDINSMKLLGALYDTLVRFKPNSFDVEPSLALSWDLSADGLLYTFKLRPGVKFHDGTDVRRRRRQVHLRPFARSEPPLRRHRAVSRSRRLLRLDCRERSSSIR